MVHSVQRTQDYMFVFAPGGMYRESAEICRLWQEKVAAKPYWLAAAKFLVFASELDMIEEFLVRATVHCDLFFGYFSTKFDLPYLVMRRNFLRDKSSVHTPFVNMIFFGNLRLPGALTCGLKVISNGMSVQFYVPCGQCRAQLFLKNTKQTVLCCPSCQASTAIDYGKIRYEKDSGSSRWDTSSFSCHIDLLEAELFRGLENRRLETVCNLNFKETVDAVRPASVGYHVRLARRITTVTEFRTLVDLFLNGIKIRLFSVKPISGEIENRMAGRLRDVFIEEERASASESSEANPRPCATDSPPVYVRWEHERNDDFASLTCLGGGNSCRVWFDVEYDERAELPDPAAVVGGLFVSVGKTSEIDPDTQRNWRTVSDLVETGFYCFVDVLLTHFLEVLVCQTTIGLFNTAFLEIFPFILITLPSGQRVLPKVIKRLMQSNFMLKLSNPAQLTLYYTSALEVEGVRATAVEVTDGLDPARFSTSTPEISRLPALRTPEEIMKFEPEFMNVNEFRLGTMGERPLDDYEEMKRALSQLSAAQQLPQAVSRKRKGAV